MHLFENRTVYKIEHTQKLEQGGLYPALRLWLDNGDFLIYALSSNRFFNTYVHGDLIKLNKIPYQDIKIISKINLGSYYHHNTVENNGLWDMVQFEQAFQIYSPEGEYAFVLGLYSPRLLLNPRLVIEQIQ